MPKCRECKYLVREKGEYGEEWCHIFGYDTPDKYVAWNGEGCRCTNKQLDRMFKESIYFTSQCFIRECKSFNEFIKMRGNK